MTPEEFRTAGHELIDWIADYRSTIHEMPVRAQVAPGDIARSLPQTAPNSAESFQTVLNDLESLIVPGITQVQHPMHFGWFPSNANLASVLGDIASSGLGTLGISWESCPSLTEVEQVVCDWLRQLTGLSESWQGSIHDTASTACLVALILGREKATDLCKNHEGIQAQEQPLKIYCTEQAHSSVAKAAILAGFGLENICIIDVDPVTYTMNPASLQGAINADIKNGNKPTAVVATCGTTNTTAMDPIQTIVAITQKESIWLHVDAAMAGTAMLLPECRDLWAGVEQADSLSWNPHKWLGTILDTSLLYVRDTRHLENVMSTNPAYLKSNADGQVRQYRDWGIPLGRRFRALKIWFQLRLEGLPAIQSRLRRDLENAQWLKSKIEQTANWEILAPVTLQTLCVRHVPQNDIKTEILEQHTLAWVEHINASGKAFLTPSKLDGLWMVRISIGVENTTQKHIADLWDMMQSAAETAWSTANPN